MNSFMARLYGRICFATEGGGAGGGTGDTGAAAAAAAAAAGGGAQSWFNGQDAEITGYIQNRGWDKLDPAAAALAATKAHQEASKLIGAPPDQVLRLAKPDDAVGTNAMWQRLGKPADAKGYDLTQVKFADGSPLDQPFLDAFTAAAHNAHLPKDAAIQVAQAVVKFMDNADLTEATERTAAVEADKALLAKNWGANMNANLIVAQNAARALGIEPETVAALESVVGYSKVMEMFRNIGTKIGEDKYVGSGGQGGGGVMTRDQAVSRKAELMTDNAWAKRYLDGGAAENREMQALLRLITGETGDYSPM